LEIGEAHVSKDTPYGSGAIDPQRPGR
jgi:hypothetical protein